MIDERFLQVLADDPSLLELDPAARRLALRARAVQEGSITLDEVSRLADLIDGVGPLTEVMADDGVTDILVNGPDEVWIETEGVLTRTSITFRPGELPALIERLLGVAGERADPMQPIVDARLQDGSRLHVVLPPLAPRGPVMSIRKVRRRPFTMGDLVFAGMLAQTEAERLVNAVEARDTVVITGGTGTGKTTLLNALLGTIDDSQRVVTVEETPELSPQCANVVGLVARRPNVEGRGAVDLETLLRAALRMRPDRIVVGETRGSEALVALEAMTTGHEGSLLTVHANSASAAIDRLVLLASRASTSVGADSLRTQFVAVIDLIVHLGRVAGTRRVIEICEPARR